MFATFLAHSGRLGDNLSNEREIGGDRRAPSYIMSLYLGSKWVSDAWMMHALRASSDFPDGPHGDDDGKSDAGEAAQ
tara:strand:+ start:15767 stop:15997 length:231 start_codon:yes stop_codon:yes gene_type:complete